MLGGFCFFSCLQPRGDVNHVLWWTVVVLNNAGTGCARSTSPLLQNNHIKPESGAGLSQAYKQPAKAISWGYSCLGGGGGVVFTHWVGWGWTSDIC